MTYAVAARTRPALNRVVAGVAIACGLIAAAVARVDLFGGQTSE
jgi:hypothetical protein